MREDAGRDERRWIYGEGGFPSLRLCFLESLEGRKKKQGTKKSIGCEKGKVRCVEMGETVLTRIWGRLGTAERHSHEEIRESVAGGDPVVKVFV